MLFLDELAVDFIFTFNLDNNDPNDQYVTQINFYSVPHKVCSFSSHIFLLS